MLSNKQALIEVKSLRKKYGTFEAVKGISFEVLQGEIFGLLGPNGAGKTTTLEIIETLRKKDSGIVKICGFDIDTQANKVKENIGVQLQASGFYHNLNLKELLVLFGGLYNVKVDVDALLAKVNLESHGRKKFKELSGGQKQRFSLVTTILNNPQIIFLDEPSTGLDPQARRNLWELILQLRDSGTTVVITTHYMDEAEFLCDRVALMEDGELIAMGAPTQLIADLLHTGFRRPKPLLDANLEDVYMHLTGKQMHQGV